MYYYGYGNSCGNQAFYPTFPTGCNQCSMGCGISSGGWIAIILVIFLILCICGLSRQTTTL